MSNKTRNCLQIVVEKRGINDIMKATLVYVPGGEIYGILRKSY